MKYLNLIIVISIISSCSTVSLTPEGEKVIVLNDAKYVKGCRKTGTVSSGSSMSGNAGLTSVGNQDSYKKLRNLAGRLGDVVVLTKNEESFLTGSDREGDVYQCAPNIIIKPVKR